MIEHPNFSLDLGPPWQEFPSDDPEMYNLRDDDRGIAVTLSSMSLDIAEDAIDQFASVLVEARLHAEGDAARALDHQTTIYEPIIVPRPWGSAVAYYGHDEGGRQFSFSGIITRRTVISLYMSTSNLSELELMQAMDDVGSRIEFDRTPLASRAATD